MRTTATLVLAAMIAALACGTASASMEDKDGELVNAAMTGKTDKVEKMLMRGAFINAKNPEGKTALMLAVEGDHYDTAELLIKRGANVNFADNGGNTPLMIAALRGQREVVRLLIAKGANVNTQQSNIKSVHASENKTPIMFAAEGGNLEVVKMLIAKGANVNKKASNGKTALGIADEKGFSDVVEVLKKAGAN